MTARGRIRWNDASIMKLTCILARRPLPSNNEIAFEMGVTLAGLQTALSRFGLSPHTRPVWNDEAIAKLRAILARDPIPPVQEIASEMGMTLSAVSGAINKFELAWRTSSTNDKPDFHVEWQPSDTRRTRKCMCCEKPFGSEGIHDRLCDTCGNSNGEIDVSEFSIVA